MATILPAIIAALATIIAAWLSRPQPPATAQANFAAPRQAGTVPPQMSANHANSPKISSSFYFGIAGFIAWFLPIVGLPVALIGVGFGILHLSEYPQRRFARIGIWLNVIALMAATANAAIGAYLGYKGQLF